MLMGSMNVVTKPDKLFFSFTQDDKVIIIGSRKVNQVDLAAEFEGYEIDSLFGGYGASGCIPMPPSYNLSGSMRGFIQVIGDTFEEALLNLLIAFRQEEQDEKQQALLAAERAAERQANPVDWDEDHYYSCEDYDCNCYDFDDDEL